MNALITGVAAGVIAAIVWAILVWRYRQHGFKHDYQHLAGEYQQFPKLSEAPDPDRIRIQVERNILYVTIDQMALGGKANGEISMSEQLRSSGRGHYVHQLDDGRRAFGFWDVQVSGAEIFVHTTYSMASVGVVQGYLWRMVEDEHGRRVNDVGRHPPLSLASYRDVRPRRYDP